MSSKTFYNKFETQTFLEKKFLNNFFYAKNFVRNNIDEKNIVQSVDNNSKITHFKAKTKLEVGLSLVLKDFVYKYKYNKPLQLQSLQSCFSLPSSINTLNLKKSLTIFSNEKSNLRLMLFLNGVKGGSLGYSAGVLGFIPKSQIKNIVQNIIQNYPNKKVTWSNLLFLLSTQHLTKKYFPFRVPFFLSNMTSYPFFQKYNFAKSTQRKRRSFRNYLNFIFTSKKVIQTSKSYKNLNKNEKFKYQKNNKFYYNKESVGKKNLFGIRKQY